MTAALDLQHDSAATHVLNQTSTTAPAIAEAIGHISPCNHLPPWHTAPITLPADLREHQEHARRFRTELTETACTCLHGLPEQLLADLARRWADALDAGVWYGQSAHRSSPEVRDHSRREFDRALRDIRALADWITSGTAAHTARGAW
jgi:hypothetical protein